MAKLNDTTIYGDLEVTGHGYFVDITTGDLNLMNGWKLVEYEEDDRNNMIDGVIIKNKNNEVIFKVTEEGLYFKGKKIA
jgi:hypothetical protein